MRRIHQILTTSLMSAVMVICMGCRSTAPRHIDQRADDALRAMSDALRDAKEFSFRAQSTMDEELETGQIAQFSSTRRALVRRPNKMFVERSGDLGARSFWYDGRTLTVLDKAANVYASVSVPDTIEKMLDHVIEEYDLTIPLADLLFHRRYDTLSAEAQSGRYVAVHKIGDTDCHHLAFRQETIDWQIWIDTGKIPLPRKILITYKNEPGRPQYSATMDKWNLSPKSSDQMFKFQPPADAQRIEMDELLETE